MTRALLLLLSPLVIAASAPIQPRAEPIEIALRAAQLEQQAAESRSAALAKAAESARGTAERLRGEQAAAAAAIEAAEARITAADSRVRLIAATAELRRRSLSEQRSPVAALLAGLVVMGERPPLLAIASGQNTDDIVAIRTLIDATLPVIRQRTAALAGQVGEAERLERRAVAARAELLEGRRDLVRRRDRFAQLEQRAMEQALTSSGDALASGDAALAAGETVDRLSFESDQQSSSQAAAAALAALGPAPAGPAASPLRGEPGFTYQLPAGAPVVEGLGSVSRSGVRSRGLVLATTRGAAVTVPASGTIRFSGPDKGYDGIVIIDHGRGWLSLLTGLLSQARPGDRVFAGEPLGRAMGKLGVELSHNGRRLSPALIAGSSRPLSKGNKGG